MSENVQNPPDHPAKIPTDQEYESSVAEQDATPWPDSNTPTWPKLVQSLIDRNERRIVGLEASEERHADVIVDLSNQQTAHGVEIDKLTARVESQARALAKLIAQTPEGSDVVREAVEQMRLGMASDEAESVSPPAVGLEFGADDDRPDMLDVQDDITIYRADLSTVYRETREPIQPAHAMQIDGFRLVVHLGRVAVYADLYDLVGRMVATAQEQEAERRRGLLL